MDRPGSNIFYHPLVVKKDIPRLDRFSVKNIRRVIEAKLGARPEIYGLPLRGTLKKYWKLRVGDWRVVYEIYTPAQAQSVKQGVYKLLGSEMKMQSHFRFARSTSLIKGNDVYVLIIAHRKDVYDLAHKRKL
ncbi:MAG: hypothetical protein Q8P86_00405 [bacterium]|nr:hypothetical protein [bacterium]